MNEFAYTLLYYTNIDCLSWTLKMGLRPSLRPGLCPRGTHTLMEEETDTLTNKWPHTVTEARIQIGRGALEAQSRRMWLSVLSVWSDSQTSVSVNFPRTAGTHMTHLSLPIRHYTGNIRNHPFVLAEYILLKELGTILQCLVTWARWGSLRSPQATCARTRTQGIMAFPGICALYHLVPLLPATVILKGAVDQAQGASQSW